jgi:adenylate kinase
MIHIVIAGPPGSGKGTQAVRLAEKYDLMHISTGEVLRDAINKGSTLGRLAKQKIENGEFVSDDVAKRIIEEFLDLNRDAKGFIFDGYPRTIVQAHLFDELLQRLGQKLAGFILLKVEEPVLIERLLSRAEKSNRADDSDLGVILHRMEIYNERTAPLIEYYENKGLLNQVVGNNNIEYVFEKICQIIDKLLIDE